MRLIVDRLGEVEVDVEGMLASVDSLQGAMNFRLAAEDVESGRAMWRADWPGGWQSERFNYPQWDPNAVEAVVSGSEWEDGE